MRGVEKPNTIIKLPDGRIGTICYNNLDGCGGIWGEHDFNIPEGEGSFNEIYPPPDFILREKEIESSLQKNFGYKIQCVGERYKVIREGWY